MGIGGNVGSDTDSETLSPTSSPPNNDPSGYMLLRYTGFEGMKYIIPLQSLIL